MSERRFVLVDFTHTNRAGCLRLHEAGRAYVLPAISGEHVAASGGKPFSPSIPFCRVASALIRLASTEQQEALDQVKEVRRLASAAQHRVKRRALRGHLF